MTFSEWRPVDVIPRLRARQQTARSLPSDGRRARVRHEVWLMDALRNTPISRFSSVKTCDTKAMLLVS